MSLDNFIRSGVLTIACLSQVACYGYRGGWESMPYVGNTPPPVPAESRTAFEASQRGELLPDGLRLQVRINNQLRTYDTQYYFFIVPLSFDPREVYTQNHEPGKTQVQLVVTALEPGFEFRPAKAILHVGGKSFVGKNGIEAGSWDAEGRRVRTGGRWERRPIMDALELSELNQPHVLSVYFDTNVPSPELHDISIDLSQALSTRKGPVVPLIRFLPVRWKEGYT